MWNIGDKIVKESNIFTIKEIIRTDSKTGIPYYKCQNKDGEEISLSEQNVIEYIHVH